VRDIERDCCVRDCEDCCEGYCEGLLCGIVERDVERDVVWDCCEGDYIQRKYCATPQIPVESRAIFPRLNYWV
jgi:hypothetical protein